MTALLVHSDGTLALATLGDASGKRLSAAPTPIPLALPSRFPEGSIPQIALTPTPSNSSSSSNIFVYAKGRPTVWEYDGKGRRLSEMNAPGGVEAAVVVPTTSRGSGSRGGGEGMNSGPYVVLYTTGGEILRMERRGKKWERTNHKIPAGSRAVLAAAKDELVVFGDGDKVWAQNYVREGWCTDGVDTPPNMSCVGTACVGPDERYLVMTCVEGIKTLSAPPELETRVFPLPFGEANALSVGSGTSLRVATIGAGSSMVAVVTLPSGSVDTVTMPGPVDCVAWMNSQTLAVCVAGDMFVHDLSQGSTTKQAFDRPVRAVYPLSTRTTRPPERVLSDSNIPNLQSDKQDELKKHKGKGKERVVSAPVPAPAPGKTGPAPLPVPKVTATTNPAVTRITGRPLATPSNPMLARPTGSDSVDTLRIRPPPIPEGDEGSPATTVAPTPGSRTATITLDDPGPAPSWEAYETLRQEIANLQLDMLRMGRGLKNEIRSAVAPLVDELRESRETIARQAAEIERLRRGF